MSIARYGSAASRCSVKDCRAGCTEKNVQYGTAPALIVRQGSASTNDDSSSRSADSSRSRYQPRITVATAWAGACGPE